MQYSKIALAIALALAASNSHATNGMSMEGYGPISTGMGGTAQAYNNGLGGMMNNPATLGMGAEAGNKLQLALSVLQPNVSSKATAPMPDGSSMTFQTDSGGDSYLMPAFGYGRKENKMTFGLGVIPQGGMGTEYGRANSMTSLFAGGRDMQNNPTALSGEPVRSEISVGRLILPFSYDLNDQLTLAASVDYIWVGMDMQMDMDGATFRDMAYSNPQTMTRTGLVGGSMLDGVEQMMGAAMAGGDGLTNIRYARFNFSNSSDYTGQATGDGFGAKVGFTYRLSNQLAVGGSYHTESGLNDLSSSATMQMAVDMMMGGQAATNQAIPVNGQIKLKDFQWPSSYALGVAYQHNKQLMFTGDVKVINWADVMDAFRIHFVADTTQANPMAQGFAGATMDITMPQKWDNQVVTMLGVQYKPMEALSLRGGLSIANNPIPSENLNPLFPATIENHYTAGVGYAFSDNSLIDAAIVYAPEVSQTNSQNGVTSTHSQTNLQLMYTYRWGVKPKILGDNY